MNDNKSNELTFKEMLNQHAIPFPDKPISEGRFTRWGPGDSYYAIRLSNGGVYFGDWRQDISKAWFPNNQNQRLSNNELKMQELQFRKAQETAEIERQKYQENVAAIALERWNQASSSQVPQHPYILRKAIQPFNVRLEGSNLIIPLHDETGKLWTLQTIDPTGNKRFLPGGKKKACFHTLGLLKESNLLYLCEGFATGTSIHMATGIPTIIAFDAYNLDPVIEVVKSKYPEKIIVICADNDQWKENNVGKEKAEAAVAKYNCKVVLPNFSPECLKMASAKEFKPTDFNDLHVLEGLEEVRRQVVL